MDTLVEVQIPLLVWCADCGKYLFATYHPAVAKRTTFCRDCDYYQEG